MIQISASLFFGLLLMVFGCQSQSNQQPTCVPKPKAVAKSVVVKPSTQPPQKFTVFVNYDAELKDVVENGQYAWKNYRLTSGYFPSGEQGERDVEFLLIQPEQPVDPETFTAMLCDHALRPATAMELMAFGRQYRNFLSENPVLAMGSYLVAWDQQTYSACLYSEAEKRFADLRTLKNPLPPNTVFAVVPE